MKDEVLHEGPLELNDTSLQPMCVSALSPRPVPPQDAKPVSALTQPPSWPGARYERHLQLPHARPQRLPGLVHPPRRVELPALFWLRRLVR